MVPDDADLLAAVEGNQDDVAGFGVEVGRDAVVEWAGERVRQQDGDAVWAGGCDGGWGGATSPYPLPQGEGED